MMLKRSRNSDYHRNDSFNWSTCFIKISASFLLFSRTFNLTLSLFEVIPL